MGGAVLDASALLALLNEEPGHEKIAQTIANGATISGVNFSEVVAKLSEVGVPEVVIHEMLDFLNLEITDFDVEAAYQAGLLRVPTRQESLSFGDRACLALAQRLGLPAFTTDKVWKDVLPGVTIQIIR